MESNETRLGRSFDLVVQALVLISIVSFSVQTLPTLSPGLRQALRTLEVVSVILFTIEYALRTIVADRKRDYVFSFFGVVDLLAILPFYLSLGIDLRSLRVVRLLRIFRIFKLARYSRAVQRFRSAASIVREELILFGCVAAVLLYLSAVGIYYFEHEAQPQKFSSIFHSLWWAVATMTTVGYGDVYPVTAGGRVFTFAVLMLGLGIIAVPSGLFASALSTARAHERQEGENEAAPEASERRRAS